MTPTIKMYVPGKCFVIYLPYLVCSGGLELF